MKVRLRKETPSSGSLSRILFAVFALLAVLSAIGLDYISWKKGNKAFFFKTRPQSERVKPSTALGDLVLERMEALNIKPDSTKQFWDSRKNQHLIIEITTDEYMRLSVPLVQTLNDAGATIVKKEEYDEKDKSSFLWRVQGPREELMSLLFSCRTDRASVQEKIPRELEKEKAKVAIIVDDMGYNLKSIYEVTRIGLPLTVAIIPFTPLVRETAELARKNGLEVILHVPMESRNAAEENKMTGIILSDMEEDEIVSTLEKGLREIPYAIGANNHMGSKITNDWSIMRVVLEHLKKQGLFFVDSLTTGDSVASRMARSLEVPTAVRDVFLDGELNEAYIQGQLRQLFRTAQKNGSAVGICHPSDPTLKVLYDNLASFQKQYSAKLVFVSTLVN